MMIVLQIGEVENNVYRLIDLRRNKAYSFCIEFHDIEPRSGDYLILADAIIGGNCGLLCFSSDITNTHGRNIKNLRINEEGDIAILIKGNKGIALKRLYG